MALNTAARGESLRIAWTVMFSMFGLVPIHYFVPCEASRALMGVASVFMIIVGGLAIIARRYTPIVWAIAALMLNNLSMH